MIRKRVITPIAQPAPRIAQSSSGLDASEITLHSPKEVWCGITSLTGRENFQKLIHTNECGWVYEFQFRQLQIHFLSYHH